MNIFEIKEHTIYRTIDQLIESDLYYDVCLEGYKRDEIYISIDTEFYKDSQNGLMWRFSNENMYNMFDDDVTHFATKTLNTIVQNCAVETVNLEKDHIAKIRVDFNPNDYISELKLLKKIIEESEDV